AHHLDDIPFRQGGDEGVQLVAAAGHLHGVAGGADVDDLTAKDIHAALHLGALGTAGADLDEHQLPLDVGALGQVHHLHHVDELVELLGDLLDDLVIAVGGEGEPRQGLVLGGGHGQGVDVV